MQNIFAKELSFLSVIAGLTRHLIVALVIIFPLTSVCKVFIKRWRIKPAMTTICTLYTLLFISTATAQNVGVNTTGPDRRLDVLDNTNPQLRLTYTDGSVYTDFKTYTSGYLSINPSGKFFGLGINPPTSLFHLYGGSANLAQEKLGQLFDGPVTGIGDGLYMDMFDFGSLGHVFSAANTGEFYIGDYGATNKYFSVITGNASSAYLGNVGMGTSLPTSVLHTVASGAKTADYTGNLFSTTATSSTASVNKIGLSVSSTGTWNGASALHLGLKATATGGTSNWDAYFANGRVQLGSTITGGAGDHIVSRGSSAIDRINTAVNSIMYQSGGANTNYVAGIVGTGLVEANGATTVANSAGILSMIGTYTSGSITNAAGYYASAVSPGVGTTITNAYGLYIEDVSASGATNSYALVSSGGQVKIIGGTVVGSPTGGDKGAGTINAQAVYDDNVLLTDYVFDKRL